VWPKGATPLTVVAVKSKLAPLRKDLERWGITSLGKGFYEFSFSSLEDVRRVRSVASWNLNPGFLKLFAWSGDFNPNLQKNSTAQVWVRLYGLSQEYWRPKILFAIASSIGTPICTDAIAAKPMFDRTFGHYARVLVDMDLTQTLRNKVLVERKGFAFYVEFDYENLPDFCTHCNMVGHYLENCKKLKIVDEVPNEKETKSKPKQRGDGSKKFVQTKDGRVEQLKSTEVIVVDNSTLPVIGQNSQPVREEPLAKVPAEKSQAQVLVHPEASTKLVAQQNRFQILTDNENIESNNQDNVNMADEDLPSTQGSEFVDASSQAFSNQGIIHERVQKDMAFLKESWANIAETEEEEEQRLLEALEKEPAPSGFKMVTSKTNKKAAASTSSTPKSVHRTRSKVGPPRTSK
jgi:hypothetical protein